MSKNKQELLHSRFIFMLMCFTAGLLLFSLCNFNVSAATSENRYDIVIEDNADLFDFEEESLLKERMEPITKFGNVLLVSIDENNTSASKYADNYYYHRYGKNSGTIFLIDMDNREIYIYSNGYNSTVLTDSYCDTITDNVYTYASKKQYYKCADKAFEQIYTLLSGNRIAQPMKYISNALLALIIAMVLLFQYVKAFALAKKPAKNALIKAMLKKCTVRNEKAVLTGTTKRIVSSGGGGGGHGGGGGGGGHGGSGGGHSF